MSEEPSADVHGQPGPEHEEAPEGEAAQGAAHAPASAALAEEPSPSPRLLLVPLLAPGPNADTGLAAPALAWLREPFVVVRRPFHRVFFGLARIAHELAHHDTGQGNEMHQGHRWHFCVKSPGALRFFFHATRTRAQVRAFIEAKP